MTRAFMNLRNAILTFALVTALPHGALAVEKKKAAPSATQNIQPTDPVARCRMLKDRLQCEKCLRALRKKGGASPLWGSGCGAGI